jgi:solute carrier family 25 carnitine/acylcarnitine transporter 20/29
MFALCFLGYDLGKAIFFKPDTTANPTAENLFRIALAGATSGFFTTPILAPLERLKCLLQVQHTNPNATTKFKGPMDLGRHIIHTEGSQALFRGYFATNLRDSVASMAYFSTYEYLKYIMLPPDPTRSTSKTVLCTLTAGGVAGIMNWLPAIPFDTLKSRLQTAPPGKYQRGIRSVAAEIYAKEGTQSLRTFYRGVGPVLIRAFPANAACFLGYETAKQFLTRFE